MGSSKISFAVVTAVFLAVAGVLAVFEVFANSVSAAPKITDPLVVKACMRANGNIRVTMTWHDLEGGVGAVTGIASYYAGARTASLAYTQFRYQTSPYPLSGRQVMEFAPAPNVPSPNDGPVNQVFYIFGTTPPSVDFSGSITDFRKC